MKSCSAEPPKNNELEVSIFGPGKGESIVLHLGLGRWMVVDSCIDQEDRTVSGLKYLRKIGADLQNVHMIVGTHAHDDHFAGIASFYEACESATFVVSDALTNAEFMALLGADAEVPKPARYSAYSEYRKIFEIAESRKNSNGIAPLRRATEGARLLHLPAASDFPSVTVTALSPSEQAKTRALRAIAAESPQVNARRGKIPALDPNDASIALWIEVGQVRILLGADLLNGPAGCGWQAVVASFKPDFPASLYKVAHHGGASSHHQPAWDKLLVRNPLAVMAPYRRGGINQPQPHDVERILSLTDRAYITAVGTPTPSRAIRREKSQLGTLAQNPRSVWGKIGQVRARCTPGEGDWKVNTVSPAGPLR
ncbi:MBL fold metallo-hydrolase [Streptomyces cavourensis]|uniref:MBL fold metallo-hydrolase n=1 Tax=Streptomyces cavourensis TaxID=67258 RepID=UPI003B96868D